MSLDNLKDNYWQGKRIFFVGIKGTGMTALAEVLFSLGANITGSDVEETFYTDELLKKRGIKYSVGFSADNLPDATELVVYSAAYSVRDNPQLQKARALGMDMYSYPKMLGLLSRRYSSSGIAGTHGKTTTTAIAGTIAKFLELPAIVIAGSEVPSFGYSSSIVMGDRFLIAETCEYRRHFLKYYPERIVLTTIEEDHLDYYRDIEDINDAFITYGRNLPFKGEIIYNADDSGVGVVIDVLKKRRDDLIFTPVGLSADGMFKISNVKTLPGRIEFDIEGLKDGIEKPFEIRIPGMHNINNSVEAIALILSLLRENGEDYNSLDIDGKRVLTNKLREALINFKGSRRRSEILGEAGGILFMDDYAHHPTEISKTLEGLSLFYPNRRLIVDFMSHTYTRTKAFLEDFGRAFQRADTVVLHDIYASAREEGGDISGDDLYREVSKHHFSVKYFKEPLDAFEYLTATLKRGDLFITMGAGNNWKLGRELYLYFKG